MYESFYGLSARPFQQRPDPRYFFGSKGHQRAMAYLDYGVAQGEGFIVITGEVGAGKTTLVRKLLRQLPPERIVPLQLVHTHLDADDLLRMVAAALALPYEGQSKAALITGIERTLRELGRQGKRALLVVDEAQNLGPRAIEELRMLSNFQTDEACLLQTFLLGQPEFRRTLLSPDMQQLRQRVIATCHLGPMEAAETRDYILHRLGTAGWRQHPRIADGAFAALHTASGGVPRRINALCDRLFLMGALDELGHFEQQHVDSVAADIGQEFAPPEAAFGTAELP